MHGISVFDNNSPFTIQWVNNPFEGLLGLEDKVRTGVNKTHYNNDINEDVEENISDGRKWHFKRKGGITAFKKQYCSKKYE